MLEWALEQAGDNREELEKVFWRYCQNPEDSLKYLSARFLISNMPYHYHYSSPQLDNYMEQYKLLSENKYCPQEINDSITRKYGKLTPKDLKLIKDIEVIDSTFLVNNIESAMRIWQSQPWNENVAFSDFCEFILPYKIGDEKLSLWRDTVYDEYIHFLDTIINKPEAEDPYYAAQIVLNSLSQLPVYFTTQLTYTPRVGPKILEWRAGNCRELADIATYVLRGLGIPCGTDFMRMRGNNNIGHAWSFILDKNRNTWITDFPTNEWKPASTYHDPKGKVYRNTYSFNHSMQNTLLELSQDIYPWLKNCRFIDVSTVYFGDNNRHLEILPAMLYEREVENKLYYLCMSNYENWEPVAWGTVLNGNICFKDVEGDVVFRIATYQQNYLVIHTDPFVLDKETGDMRLFRDSGENESLELFFKFHLLEEHFLPRMLNGIFQGSNRPDFKNADTLHIIQDIPYRLCTNVHLSPSKKYRYYRYKGFDWSHCNIAEMVLFENYNDTLPLTGDVIGTPGCYQGDGSHEYTNVFDGDPCTSFDYIDPFNGWVGLDLGTPRFVERIVYTPRNRDNFVRPGDTYELLYWSNKQWNSAGKQVARSDSLVYSVPSQTLYYLRNHTRGKQERIFEYKDGKQFFW